MIDIIGFIKVDESKPERINYLMACIRSYKFLANAKSDEGVPATITIAMDKPSVELGSVVSKELKDLGFNEYCSRSIIVNYPKGKSYGAVYNQIIDTYGKNKYIINFMEDQFMVADAVDTLKSVLARMGKWSVQVCKSSFFDIETKCLKSLQHDYQPSYLNSQQYHDAFQRPYYKRYWLGVNFITTKEFALKFWGRECGIRPHDYEVEHYTESLLHRVIVPEREIQAAIDDDHGEPNTCLIKRQDKKFLHIMATVTQRPTEKDNTPLAYFNRKENISTTGIHITRDEPWITEGANIVLAAYMSYHNLFAQHNQTGYGISVLEFGMGASTLFFSEQKCVTRLVSIEHNKEWYDHVVDKIKNKTAGIYGLYDRPYNSKVSYFPDNAFDVIMIDGRDRVECIKSSISKLKPGGILILDNSERETYAEGIALMSDWKKSEFVQEQPDKYGFGYEGWKTTVFCKP